MDHSLPGSSVPGISQIRILEWVVISFSRVSSWTGIEPSSLARQEDSLLLNHQGNPKSGVQFSSVAQSCPTLCNPMNRSTPGLPVHHQLPEFTQTHGHQVSDAIQPSHPLSSPSPPVPNPCQQQGLAPGVSWLLTFAFQSPILEIRNGKIYLENSHHLAILTLF